MGILVFLTACSASKKGCGLTSDAQKTKSQTSHTQTILLSEA